MRSVDEREYVRGDMAAVKCRERDPFPGWCHYLEQNADGLTSYWIEDMPAAVIGFVLTSPGVGDAFAMIDRELATGSGQELASAVKARIIAHMKRYGLHRVQCTLDPEDRAAKVFLRATGYRFESVMRQGAPDKTDLHVYAILEK